MATLRKDVHRTSARRAAPEHDVPRPPNGNAIKPSLEEVSSAFGQHFKAKRLNTGLSQERFAEGAGVDRSFVGKIEQGRSSPSLVTLVQLARGFNTTVSGFLDGFDDRLASKQSDDSSGKR
jgi:DNA-binding XRE family transcriptional regulator